MILSSCRTTVSRIIGGEKNIRGGHKEAEKQRSKKGVQGVNVREWLRWGWIDQWYEEWFSEKKKWQKNKTLKTETAKSKDYHSSNEILTSGLFIRFKHNSGLYSRLVFSLEQVGPSRTSLTEIGEVWGSSVEKSLSVCVCLLCVWI